MATKSTPTELTIAIKLAEEGHYSVTTVSSDELADYVDTGSTIDTAEGTLPVYELAEARGE